MSVWAAIYSKKLDRTSEHYYYFFYGGETYFGEKESLKFPTFVQKQCLEISLGKCAAANNGMPCKIHYSQQKLYISRLSQAEVAYYMYVYIRLQTMKPLLVFIRLVHFKTIKY